MVFPLRVGMSFCRRSGRVWTNLRGKVQKNYSRKGNWERCFAVVKAGGKREERFEGKGREKKEKPMRKELHCVYQRGVAAGVRRAMGGGGWEGIRC